MRKGTTRVVFLVGKYAIKFPRVSSWKMFLRGILANLDEKLWYNNSPDEWRLKMCPAIMCIGGFVLVSKRCEPISANAYDLLDIEYYKPIPMDNKISNFGWYQNRVVLVDYADSRYFCSDCEVYFKSKCHSKILPNPSIQSPS